MRSGQDFFIYRPGEFLYLKAPERPDLDHGKNPSISRHLLCRWPGHRGSNPIAEIHWLPGDELDRILQRFSKVGEITNIVYQQFK